jgi:hypothetical protein
MSCWKSKKYLMISIYLSEPWKLIFETKKLIFVRQNSACLRDSIFIRKW